MIKLVFVVVAAAAVVFAIKALQGKSGPGSVFLGEDL